MGGNMKLILGGTDTEEDILIESIVQELNAVKVYRNFGRKTNHDKIERLMNDVADEEMEHIGEFIEALDGFTGLDYERIKDGMEEAEEILGR